MEDILDIQAWIEKYTDIELSEFQKRFIVQVWEANGRTLVHWPRVYGRSAAGKAYEDWLEYLNGR